MTKTKVAYVRPTGGDKGRLSFPDGSKELEYLAQNVEVDEGFYRVTYKYGHSLVFLNKIQPVSRQEVGTLKQTVETVPRIPKKVKGRLLEKLSGLSEDEAYRKLSDKRFLRKVQGIGRATAKIVSETVGNQSRSERKLLQALGKFNIEVDIAASWYQYLRGYFEHYASAEKKRSYSISDIKKNPYLLYRIQKDWRALDYLDDNYGIRPGRKLSFEKIDKHVLASDIRWQYDPARVKEYTFLVLQDAKSDGHSVIDLDDCVARLKSEGIDYVYDETFSDEERSERDKPLEINTKSTRRLVARTHLVENVRFMRSSGQEEWGVCLAESKRWHDRTVTGLKSLVGSGPLLSTKETQNQRSRALKAQPFELTEAQKSAVENAFGSRISAITGGAGTGKTAVLQAALQGMLVARTARHYTNPVTKETTRRTGHHVYVLAPTGVAAQRIRLGLELEDQVVYQHGLRRSEEVELSDITHRVNNTSYDDSPTRFMKQGSVHLGTMHSFLGYRGGSTYLLPAAHPSIIFIDEMSMVDEEVFSKLMTYCTKCADKDIPVMLVLVGDHYQLPPVGVGFPFRDMMGSTYGAAIPVTELQEVKRQGEGSMVVHAANQIKEKRLPPSPEDYQRWGLDYDQLDFAWHNPKKMPKGMGVPDILSNYASYLTRKEAKQVSMRDIQVILPLKNQSKIEPEAPHTRRLNGDLQEHYAKESGRELREYRAKKSDDGKPYQAKFALGDKVIHVGDNGYSFAGSEPINRGSVGRIAKLTDYKIEVRYPWLGELVGYKGATGFGSLELAYAITGHSAQGSEYDYVLEMLPERAAINPRNGESIIDRSWLYTAVTRAKKHLMLVASPSRVSHAVSHSSGLSRSTLLARELVRI